MTRVSLLYLNQPGRLSDRSCLCVELRGFLSKPRLYDDAHAKDFGPSGYTGPAIMVVENHDVSHGDIRGSIQNLLHPHRRAAFPDRMVYNFMEKDDCQIPQYTNHDSDDIWSIIKYRGAHGSLGRSQSWLSEDRVSDFTKILRRQNRMLRSNTRVATWICTDTSVFLPNPKIRIKSFIVLMFEKKYRMKNAETYAEILQNLFTGDSGIADAIQDHPMLIYLYMHFCFNDFNLILKSYESLFKLSTTITGRTTWGVSDRSFLLNQALIQISFSLPDILQNRALLKRLKEYNKSPVMRHRGVRISEDLDDAVEQANQTLLSIEDDVSDFERQVDMFLERFKASLELEFSVADERMSWVMMWFTFVAIIFTPMAFVASIFGMTSLEADPKWFAAAVIPVFLASCGLCFYIFDKSQRLDDGLRPKRLQDLLHLMPYSQIASLRRRKKHPSHTKSSSHMPWETKESRRHSHYVSGDSGLSDLAEDSSDDSRPPSPPLRPSHRPPGRPPVYVSVPPPPPAPAFEMDTEPGVHGRPPAEMRPPSMGPSPSYTGGVPPPPPGAYHSRPSATPIYVNVGPHGPRPHRTSSIHPRPSHGKGKAESSTTYSNLVMPDFTSRHSNHPRRWPQTHEQPYVDEEDGSSNS